MNISLPILGGSSSTMTASPLLPTSPTTPSRQSHSHSRNQSLSHGHRSARPSTATSAHTAQGGVTGTAAAMALANSPSLPSPSSSTSTSSGTAAAAGTGFSAIPLRVIQYGLAILLRIRARLPAPVRPWFWVGLWFMFAMVSVAVFAGFHTRIFELLETMATFIKNLGRAGPPIIMVCLFFTAFPPIFGYSSLVTMSGYVYGFKFGLFIAYTSALLGSIACFYLCRKWFKVQVRALMAKKPSMKSVVKAVEKRGFRLMILIRLAPYPFNVMNALLSTTHIPLSTYTLATALSLSKLALHVYIGSTLSSLAALPPALPSLPPMDGDQGENTPETALPGTEGDSHGRNLKIVVMVISMTLGIAVGAYVWLVAKREIEASEGIRIERRRKRRESMRQSRLFARANANAVATAVNGSHLHHQSQMVARIGSGDQLLNSMQQHHGHNTAGAAMESDFVGGATLFTNQNYRDEEDVAEDQALVQGGRQGRSGTHSAARSPTSPSFQMNAHPHAHLEYGTDSEESDYLDDYDDDDVSDMERGGDDDNFIGNRSPLPPYQLHPATLQRTNSSGSSRQGGATEMEVRHPSPQPRVSSSSASLSNPLNHDTSMGWFAQNGIDTGDRSW
ncbi:hypothetical protein EMPS_10498 [Entomortierella parvispora]|uniref:Golgi apparatus membrane protein TVP38 n=1 Tax=Entomortierella parvispora TaxID=205924 RepID=A0A9P3HJY2_9FUNG|nr:hypothetical protein EMPS_10498 [Entomortierella parvispora]